MSEEKKQAIIETLDKVDKDALPLFIKHTKGQTLLHVMFGMISKETGDLLIETCAEYLKDYEEKKRIAEKLETHKTYHKPTVDLSKIKPFGKGVSE